MQLWIKTKKLNIYGTAKIADLPAPELYVAYNGPAPLNEIQSIYKMDYPDIKIEVVVKIIDINYEKLTDKTPANALVGYAFFYKEYEAKIKQGLTQKEAFDSARETCIAQDYLKGFIEREEFIMLYKDILDYDTQLKEEGKIEGKIEGITEGIALAADKFMEFIAKGLTPEEAKKKLLEG